MGFGPSPHLDRRAHDHRAHNRPSFHAGNVDGRDRIAGRRTRQLDASATLSLVQSHAWILPDVPDQLGILLQRASGNYFAETQDLEIKAVRARVFVGEASQVAEK